MLRVEVSPPLVGQLRYQLRLAHQSSHGHKPALTWGATVIKQSLNGQHGALAVLCKFVNS
jgi:hypothetical protein